MLDICLNKYKMYTTYVCVCINVTYFHLNANSNGNILLAEIIACASSIFVPSRAFNHAESTLIEKERKKDRTYIVCVEHYNNNNII